MAIRITGMEAVQRELEELGKFTTAVAKYRWECNAADTAAVQAAIRKMEQDIDREARHFPSNQAVKKAAPPLKLAQRRLLEEAARKAKR